MKTIYIIRHAKSSWGDNNLDDFDRGLSSRGKNDVEIMGLFLKKKNILPDIIYSSPAKRAKKTCKKICNIINYPEKGVIYEQEIYDNHMIGIDYYIGLIKQISNDYDTVGIIGHNYVWNDFAEYLLGIDIGNIPTCGIVAINFEVDLWENISASSGKLDFFVYPKMFRVS